MIGCGQRKIVACEGSPGRIVVHRHDSETPGVVLGQLLAEDRSVNRYRGSDKGIVDRRPLVAVVACHPYYPIELAGESGIESERRSKKLGKSRILCPDTCTCHQQREKGTE